MLSSLHTKPTTETHRGYKQHGLETRKHIYHMMLHLALACDRALCLKDILVALLADRPPGFWKAEPADSLHLCCFSYTLFATSLSAGHKQRKRWHMEASSWVEQRRCQLRVMTQKPVMVLFKSYLKE